jgi:hypothetical protein
MLLVPHTLFAQYSSSNNQLEYVSGLQIKEDGEVIYNKKKWSKRSRKKQDLVIMFNSKKIQTNTWDEGPVKIAKRKNKVEVKYKDLKAKELEIEYVFQAAKEEKNDVTSLTNYQDKKVTNFTQCVGKKCLTLTEKFCAELNANIGTDKKDAAEKAKQCLSFSKGMGNFNPEGALIKDLKKLHTDNLTAIDGKLDKFFDYESNLKSNTEFELITMIGQGKDNENYFNLLIEVLNACEKNFK